MEPTKCTIPLQEIFNSTEEFLIRPFVYLKGQRNGYKFNGIRNNRWRAFMNANVKKFNKDHTGNRSQSENAIANAFYYGKCRVDSWELKQPIGKYKFRKSKQMRIQSYVEFTAP